jgi:S1-C subfamily serine protease
VKGGSKSVFRHPTIVVSVAATAILAAGVVQILRRRAEPDAAPSLLTEAAPCLESSPHQWRILKSARDRYLGEMERVNRDVALRPKPGADKDSVSELIIERVSPESPFSRAGLQKNDRILSVNGRPVDTMSRAIGLANELRRQTRVDLEIERGGNRILYRFDFE